MGSAMEVTAIARAFAAGLTRILGAKLYGVYLYGAAAFPDVFPTGDIDYHVILRAPLSAPERVELEALHRALAAQYPPLGGELAVQAVDAQVVAAGRVGVGVDGWHQVEDVQDRRHRGAVDAPVGLDRFVVG